jgi:ankyrin repeat protein
MQAVLGLLKSKAMVSNSFQACFASKENHRTWDELGYSQRVPMQGSGLHLGAYFGLVEAMRSLLAIDEEYEPNSRDVWDRTPLWWAAVDSHREVIEMLLNMDTIDAESKDIDGKTTLWWASWNGDEWLVKLLLAWDGIDPDPKERGNWRTALSCAAENGNEGVVKLLLEHKGVRRVNPNSRSMSFRTPLWYAARAGEIGTIKLLIANGADPDTEDDHERTALEQAEEHGHKEVVELLAPYYKVH